MFKEALIVILCALNIQNRSRCRLNVNNDFTQETPIVIRDGSLLEPNDKYGDIEMLQDETLTLSCGNTGHLIHPSAIVNLRTATITCLSDDTFVNAIWLSGPSAFYAFGCSGIPNYEYRKTNRTCYNMNYIYEVGYDVDSTFYPLYESCFDEMTLQPIYIKYTQKAYNHNFQTRVKRPFFATGNVFRDVPIDRLFSPPGQRLAIANRIGSSLTENYLTANQCLSRGHLVAKTDFVFSFGQRGTFHYLNCAPQWTGFNHGNWNTLEVELRRRIHDAEYETVVYTGTFGVSQLKDENGRSIDLYLYNDVNNNPIIPVPKYYYKVVYAPDRRRGIAFVGINNPYINQSEARELSFCEDVCRGNKEFSWLVWAPDSVSKGYSFCCSVTDFQNTVGHLPRFDVRGLLT